MGERPWESSATRSLIQKTMKTYVSSTDQRRAEFPAGTACPDGREVKDPFSPRLNKNAAKASRNARPLGKGNRNYGNEKTKKGADVVALTTATQATKTATHPREPLRGASKCSMLTTPAFYLVDSPVVHSPEPPVLPHEPALPVARNAAGTLRNSFASSGPSPQGPDGELVVYEGVHQWACAGKIHPIKKEENDVKDSRPPQHNRKRQKKGVRRRGRHSNDMVKSKHVRSSIEYR